MDFLQLYLTIRFRQTFRFLKDAGWGYLLVLIPMALLLIFGLLESSQKGNTPTTALALLVLVVTLHFQRKDHDFLSRLEFHPALLRLLDYALLLVPFIVAMFFLHCPTDAWLLMVATPVIALIRPPDWLKSFRLVPMLSFIPLQAFEWRSALRRYGWAIMLLYFPAFFAAKFTIVPIALTLLLALMAVSYFDELEGKELLEVFLPLSGFLRRKAWWQGLCFHGLLLPHYLLFLIFHLSYWYILVVTIVVAELFLLFCLVYKYAHWRPGRPKAYNQMPAGFFAGGLLMPFLAPASLFYLWVYYRKAKTNIKYYYGKH